MKRDRKKTDGVSREKVYYLPGKKKKKKTPQPRIKRREKKKKSFAPPHHNTPAGYVLGKSHHPEQDRQNEKRGRDHAAAGKGGENSLLHLEEENRQARSAAKRQRGPLILSQGKIGKWQQGGKGGELSRA